MPALGVAAWALMERLGTVGVGTVRSAMTATRSLSDVAYVLVPVWAMVGAGSLLASVAEVELFDIGEPIVRLTAVHYLYAGTGALTIAHRTMVDGLPGARLPMVAVAATASAPPIVAAGFVLGHPIPQIGGAALMTVGIWVTAALLLSTLRQTSSTGNRALRGLAGVTPWAPMVLAVAWATAQHVPGVPALSVPDMARTHGLANGVGFVILGLLSTRTPSPCPAPSADLEMAS